MRERWFGQFTWTFQLLGPCTEGVQPTFPASSPSSVSWPMPSPASLSPPTSPVEEREREKKRCNVKGNTSHTPKFWYCKIAMLTVWCRFASIFRGTLNTVIVLIITVSVISKPVILVTRISHKLNQKCLKSVLKVDIVAATNKRLKSLELQIGHVSAEAEV